MAGIASLRISSLARRALFKMSSWQAKITGFFSPPANPVRWMRDYINSSHDQIDDAIKSRLERQHNLATEKATIIAEKHNEARRLERKASRQREEEKDAAELEANVLHFEDEEEDGPGILPDVPMKKGWEHRPDHWEAIVEFYRAANNSIEAVMIGYPETFAEKTPTQVYKKMARWAKDFDQKKSVKVLGRKASYGEDIEKLLIADVRMRMKHNLPLDYHMLNMMLNAYLTKFNRLHLLKCNGGGHVYSDTWAWRFYKKYKLVRRVVTTKARESPVDFDKKKEVYTAVGARLIHEFNVPDDLIFGVDETNVMFVSKAKYTFAKEGAKKVSSIGMGDNDKAQITVTVGVTAAGEVLPAQMIFGGKTVACHPNRGKTPPPEGIFYDHTESHWQSPSSYMRYIENVLVPARARIIQRLNLPLNQVAILKHDLHYSHKDPDVLALLKLRFFVPLYVPAGCTDLIQECDTVVNKPFKTAVRSAFRDYLHAEFDAWLKENGNEPGGWVPVLSIGVLKPKLTAFVQQGVAAISTPEFRTTIVAAFKRDGALDEMRKPARVAAAHAAITAVVPEVIAIPDGVEVECDEEEVVFQDEVHDVVEDTTPEAATPAAAPPLPQPVAAQPPKKRRKKADPLPRPVGAPPATVIPIAAAFALTPAPAPAPAPVPTAVPAPDAPAPPPSRRGAETRKCYSCAKFTPIGSMFEDTRLKAWKCDDCWFGDGEP